MAFFSKPNSGNNTPSNRNAFKPNFSSNNKVGDGVPVRTTTSTTTTTTTLGSSTTTTTTTHIFTSTTTTTTTSNSYNIVINNYNSIGPSGSTCDISLIDSESNFHDIFTFTLNSYNIGNVSNTYTLPPYSLLLSLSQNNPPISIYINGIQKASIGSDEGTNQFIFASNLTGDSLVEIVAPGNYPPTTTTSTTTTTTTQNITHDTIINRTSSQLSYYYILRTSVTGTIDPGQTFIPSYTSTSDATNGVWVYSVNPIGVDLYLNGSILFTNTLLATNSGVGPNSNQGEWIIIDTGVPLTTTTSTTTTTTTHQSITLINNSNSGLQFTGGVINDGVSFSQIDPNGGIRTLSNASGLQVLSSNSSTDPNDPNLTTMQYSINNGQLFNLNISTLNGFSGVDITFDGSGSLNNSSHGPSLTIGDVVIFTNSSTTTTTTSTTTTTTTINPSNGVTIINNSDIDVFGPLNGGQTISANGGQSIGLTSQLNGNQIATGGVAANPIIYQTQVLKWRINNNSDSYFQWDISSLINGGSNNNVNANIFFNAISPFGDRIPHAPHVVNGDIVTITGNVANTPSYNLTINTNKTVGSGYLVISISDKNGANLGNLYAPTGTNASYVLPLVQEMAPYSFVFNSYGTGGLGNTECDVSINGGIPIYVPAQAFSISGGTIAGDIDIEITDAPAPLNTIFVSYI